MQFFCALQLRRRHVSCSKAVKVMLIGYPLVRMPEDDDDVLLLITQAADGVYDYHAALLFHHLTKSDLVWVMSLGAFRTAYRLVWHAVSSLRLRSYFMPYILPIPLTCWLTCLACATARLQTSLSLVCVMPFVLSFIACQSVLSHVAVQLLCLTLLGCLFRL